MALTRKQLKVLQVIRDYIDVNGCSPSMDELAKAAGVSSRGNIHRYVTQLRARGHIRSLPNMARSIEVINCPDTKKRVFLPAPSEVGANHGEDYGHCIDYCRLKWGVGGHNWLICIRVMLDGTIQEPCINWNGKGNGKGPFSATKYGIPPEITEEAQKLLNALRQEIK